MMRFQLSFLIRLLIKPLKQNTIIIQKSLKSRIISYQMDFRNFKLYSGLKDS